MPESSLLQRLKERKLVQWALAYLAGAFVVFQLLDALETPLDLTATLQRAVLVIVGIGLFITLILAWYHGEKGRQRVSGPELLMVAALMVVAGAAVAVVLGRGQGVDAPGIQPLVTPPDDRPGIAVLPCENIGPNPDDTFLSDGLHGEIISKLQSIPGLRTIGRSSVLHYKEDPPPTRTVSEELNVGFVGGCRVRKHPNREEIRVDFELLDSTGVQQWGNQYDRDLTAQGLFDIQGDIAEQIAFQVGVALTPEERDEIGQVLTSNTDAYLLYMRGNEAFLHERLIGAGGVGSSIGFYEQAIGVDPRFPLARARLALSLMFTLPDEERYERARREAEQALTALPGLAEARVALGRYYYRLGQPEEAMRHYQAAEAENPNLALAILELGRLQRALGEFDTGVGLLERAAGLEPRNPVVQRALARSYIHAHRYEEALRATAIREAADSAGAEEERAWIHLLRGELEEARLLLSRHLDASWQNYGIGFAYPTAVKRRFLTDEQKRIAFESFRRDYEGPCTATPFFCTRKATHEVEVGSKDLALVYWDSVRMVVEERPPQTWHDLVYLILAYRGLGEKEAAIGTAERLVALDGAPEEGATPDRFHDGPGARVFFAQILAHFGELDRAVDILEEELPAPSWLSVPLLTIDPIWDPLRNHPRFQALLDKGGAD